MKNMKEQLNELSSTIKQEVTAETLKAIEGRPEWIFPLYSNDDWFTSCCYKGKVSNHTMRINGYEYSKARDLDHYIYDKEGKRIHGNKGVFVNVKNK
jgi:hypothetical protein